MDIWYTMDMAEAKQTSHLSPGTQSLTGHSEQRKGALRRDTTGGALPARAHRHALLLAPLDPLLTPQLLNEARARAFAHP